MKLKYILPTLLFLVSVIIGCDDNYLDTPPEHLINATAYFNSAEDLKTYTNSFYGMLPGQDVYQEDENSDNILPLIVSDRVKGTRLVPVERGSAGWNWEDLRTINFFLEHCSKCPDEDAKKHYSGVAKFFRAYFYYNKVKMYGDVPWYSGVLNAGDEDLYKARDSRVLVMDSVLTDINYAIENIPAEVNVNQITKYSALALKARLCLFEGTFRKYHNLGDYQVFLNEAVDASSALIQSGQYGLFKGDGPDAAYRNLFDRLDQISDETILARDYNANYIRHNMGYLMTAPTMGAYGIPKDLVNCYLMKDGSRFTDKEDHDEIGFYEEMQDRDPRLTQTTAGPDFIAYGASQKEPVDLSATTTGYRVIKALSSKEQWNLRSSVNDIIIFRFAEALLIYAEAKAELGTIIQTDLDISINRLRDRVEMPHLSLAEANASPDPFLENMYPNVESGANKGVILEIRRERRIEMFMEGLRWDDLMRWKEGKKLEKPVHGIYFSSLGAFDFDNDGSADVFLHDGNASGAPSGTPNIINVNIQKLTNGTSGNFDPFPAGGSFDEEKDYFFPIPLEDLNLNSNLEQNPGW
ncbi:RagB/SusD family nutrient uptake outer membrane protein [uncultured Draconibacterium sp.]|uniref:RagB/SusD family nutrient uptake outer membrane protein n=1 Tax=uncultured Draconibacterium sp. TaxID=1573823 RepID=UPI0029C62E9C|nr:RagB/SusD family nutrient uptake outer membrane protein [uncultured Draconibacterium sp.]